jgi:hypothetical protein
MVVVDGRKLIFEFATFKLSQQIADDAKFDNYCHLD